MYAARVLVLLLWILLPAVTWACDTATCTSDCRSAYQSSVGSKINILGDCSTQTCQCQFAEYPPSPALPPSPRPPKLVKSANTKIVADAAVITTPTGPATPAPLVLNTSLTPLAIAMIAVSASIGGLALLALIVLSRSSRK